MRIRTASAAFALALALPIGGEAAACVFLAVARVGPPPSARELADERSSHLRALRSQRGERARLALAAGVDPAAALAEMLVPNIRPVPILRSDCGPENEIDPAPDEETPEDALRGTRFAGRAEEFPEIFRDSSRVTFGPMCNAEFRSRFADHVRRRLDARELRDAYRFLGSFWDPPGRPEGLRWRLARFETGTRRPPVRWYASEPEERQQIERWTRLVPAGRALKSAMDAFWRDAAPQLDDGAHACPTATAAWPAEQARIVAEIQERIDVREAARRPVR